MELASQAMKAPSLGQLAMVYRMTENTLKGIRQRGVDVTDAREVFKALRETARKPVEWREFFEVDSDNHEHWKLQKTKEEVEALRLKNAKLSGQMFDKSDGEKIQEAWAAALKTKLAERRTTAPPTLAGKDEGSIYQWFELEDDKLLTELSDLESGLWKQVDEKNMEVEESSVDDEASGGTETASKGKRKSMVRQKR
jgi:hypothetical protein